MANENNNRKDNTGSFFVNNKDGNDKKPDYFGNVMINKEKIYTSVWKRVAAKTQREFFSLSFSIPNSDFSIKDPDQENNKGVLFKNEKKEKETHPDYTGKGKILGVNYYIDAWENHKGDKVYYSFTIKEVGAPKNEGGNNIENQNQDNGYDPSNESQIPFDDHDNHSENDSSAGNSSSFDIFTMGQG